MLVKEIKMSKIQAVNQNYLANSGAFKKQFKLAQDPSFSGGNTQLTGEAEKLIMKTVEGKIDKQAGVVGKLSSYLGANDSEMQTQVINAIFTSSLAPLFIAMNPFSKEDKKTKEYTALRQPISAGIAISGGVAMTLGINAFFAKLSSEGLIKSIDLRIKPDAKDYLKYDFKKEYRNAPDKKAFLENCKPNLEDWDSSAPKLNGDKPTRKYMKACQAGYAKKIQDVRKNLFTNLIGENPENIKIDESTKTISILKKGKLVELGKNIPNLGTQAELNSYLKDNNLHQVKFSKFMKDEFKFEFFEDGKLKPYVVEKNLGEVKAMEFLRKFGVAGDSTALEGKVFNESELNKIMCMTSQEKRVVNSLKDSFNPSALKNGGAEQIATATGKQASRIAQGLVGEKLGKQESITLGQFFHHMNIKGDGLQKLMDMNMSEALTSLSKNFKGKKMEGFNEKAGVTDFAKNIMKNKIERAGSDFKNFSKYGGIFFNLFTTAITCTVLNWAYPRIVERLFPSLVKPDPAKAQAKKGESK